MKLQTSIRARKDGTVKALGLDGKTHVFTPDVNGDMSCDVTCERTAAMLLSTGNFWPEDQADLESALALVQTPEDLDPEDDDLDEDEPGDGLPLEAGTPPAPKSKAKAKAAAQK
jgi:hypothetical protein